MRRSRFDLRKPVYALVGLALVPGLIVSTSGTASADAGDAARLRLVEPAHPDDGKAVVAPSLRRAKGRITVSVRLSEAPVAEAVPEDAITDGELPSKESQQARTDDVEAQQDRVIREAKKLGARSLGRATLAVNAVAVSVPATKVDDLAEIPGVVSVKPVGHYEVNADPGGSGSLAQAAQYLGATPIRNAGYDGRGIKVAVLDSGIDFTHQYLGGPGTSAAYQSCYQGSARDAAPVGACAALFGPSAPKVKGGYDFVGEAWPGGSVRRDPNPIDAEGHGTHVADILGGRSADGSHKGIAPGVSLYAVKVCSAQSSACNGVALLEGLDWALDPNGDNDISDAMDIVNLSLGQTYGQTEDDSSLAVDNLVRAGVVAVASAGNDADRPFNVGSPSTAARAISVAQTALPDDKLFSIKVVSPQIPGLPGNVVRHARLQPWSPAPASTVQGRLAQPNGNHEGCTAGTFAGFPAGAIALVKRGSCDVSLKAQNAQAAGASAVVIWNNVGGDPPDFSFGGGVAVTKPSFTIAQNIGTSLSRAVAAGTVQVAIDPRATTALRNTVVGTTSRGVAIAGRRAKPDIGAPGAWLSAEVGTGDQRTAFGGTSGAAPVVSGAAALILDRHPGLKPSLVKARLLNAASTANRTPDANANFYRTPITRIGAGELRIGAAVNNPSMLRTTQTGNGNIGLRIQRLTTKSSYTVRIKLYNNDRTRHRYRLSSSFRDASDQARRAVKVSVPRSVSVGGRSSKTVKVRFSVDPKRLKSWPLVHRAGSTSNGTALNGPEFDGFITASTGSQRLHLGWTVLPHRSASVKASSTVKLAKGRGTLKLRNRSRVRSGWVHAYALTGTSGKLPKPRAGQPGSPGSNVAQIDLAATGVYDDPADDVLGFAIAAYRRQVTPLYPAGYEVDVDVDRDGSADYAIFQEENGGFGASAQSVVYVYDINADEISASYYADADYYASTVVLNVPLSALGLRAGSTFDFGVYAYDNYFSLRFTDAIEGQSWTVGRTKYQIAGAPDARRVPPNRSRSWRVTASTTPVRSSQKGLLLFYDDAVKHDYQVVKVSR